MGEGEAAHEGFHHLTLNVQDGYQWLTNIVCNPLYSHANALRVEYARMLLRDGSLTIDDVASRCGLTDGRHLRRLWREAYGSAPSQSRALQSP